jgi:hypothetical protein
MSWNNGWEQDERLVAIMAPRSSGSKMKETNGKWVMLDVRKLYA